MMRLLTAAALPCAVAVRALARHELLRLVLTLSVAAGTLPAAAQTAARPSAPPPPNIVVFLVDDMGVMDTSVPFLTGEGGRPVRYPLNDYYRTPNMERLAARGIRFSNCMAMSVCSPTRISIVTGQNAARHRTTNWIDPATNNRDAQGPPDWNWRGLTKTNVTLPSALCRDSSRRSAISSRRSSQPPASPRRADTWWTAPGSTCCWPAGTTPPGRTSS